MNLPSFNDLSPFYNDLDIIKQTAAQVIKDFDGFSIDIQFSGDTLHAYDELFRQIEPEVKRFMDNDYQRLLDLLYRIDVNEKKVAEEVEKRTSEELSAILTDLILNRELQKVVTRNYFKNNP